MTDTATPAGFDSESEFRNAFARVFGSVATESDANDVLRIDWIDTPFGPMIAGASSDAVVLLEFSDRKILEGQLETLRRRFALPIVPRGGRWLQELRRQLAEYFAGERRDFALPLKYPGTVFQEKVWSTLLTIPYGETWSYLEMARKIGDTKATRAVGTANGMNRIAIVIPCHRVINANGQLGGYGGGLWRKRILLDLEQGQGKLFDAQ